MPDPMIIPKFEKNTEILSVPHKKIFTLQCIGQNFLSDMCCNIMKTIELYQKLDVRYPIKKVANVTVGVEKC